MGASNIPRCVLLGATAGVPARRTCAELCFQTIPLVTLPTWSRTWQRTRSFITTTSTRRPATCIGTQAIRARAAGPAALMMSFWSCSRWLGLARQRPAHPLEQPCLGWFDTPQLHRSTEHPSVLEEVVACIAERQGHTSRSVAGRCAGRPACTELPIEEVHG